MSGAHAASTPKRFRSLLIGLGVVVLALAVGAGAFVLSRSTSSGSATPSATTPLPAFAVTTAIPSNSATVDSNASIRIALSQPLDPSSPMPTLSPAVPGSWQRLSPSTIAFVQAAPFQPGQTVTVTIPGGPSGLKAASGSHLSASTSSSFQIAPLSMLRVQQLLAELGYLPLAFTPTTPSSTPGAGTADEAGSFSWRWSTLPSTLTSLWTPGATNVITQGAIMRFEDANSMPTDGQAGPQVWAALLAARSANKATTDPYNYVYVSQQVPQSLSLWSNGAVTYQTPVNTGIKGQETAVGTFPVYLRYKVTTMSGTNPDGTKYHDEGIPWTSYFHGGDALHGFIRPSYGTPQSLGCVEMPFANAGIVWPQTPIGTLVSVAAP